MRSKYNSRNGTVFPATLKMSFDDGSPIFKRDYNMNESYFQSQNNSTLIHDYGSATIFLRGSGSLILRAGLILIQFACIPSINVNGIILQNLIDLSCATTAYAMLGYMLSFGHDRSGVVGWGGWILAAEADIENAVVGLSTIIAVTGIYTTMFAGRLHQMGCILITTFLAALIIPVIMHWIWAPTGWMNRATFLQNYVSYKDHGGGILIHVCGGIVGFIGNFFLGRRLLRLENIHEGSLTAASAGSATVGYILVMYGLMTGCLPTSVYELTHEPMNYISLIFFNNILAATGGIIIVVLLQLFLSRHLLLQYWTTLRYMQGAIAGIVTIASGADVYTPYVALGLGVSGGILFYVIAYFIFYSALEDYANIIAAHLSCGFLSTLLPPLCGSHEGFGVPNKILIHFAWQVIGDLAISATIIALTIIIFLIMKIFHLLRNEEENECHQRAMAVLSRGPGKKCFQRLWGIKPESLFLQPECKSCSKSNQQDLEVSRKQGMYQVLSSTTHTTLRTQDFPLQEYLNAEYNKGQDIRSSTENDNL